MHTRQRTGYRAWRRGHGAEIAGALYLLCKGYRILGLNRRTPFGEIDIVAAKNGSLIAVEVKLRGQAEAAASAIHKSQQARLLNALQSVAARARINYGSLRCDALLFTPGKILPDHIKSAF